VAQDPWAIDNSGGLPAYSGQELRLTTVAPFLAGNGTALGTRSGVRLGGSGTELLVQAQASPNMTVKVNPGIFVAQGQTSSTQGAYTWCLDTVTNLTISAAHATLARTDLIVVRIRDGNVIVITGTAGGGVPSLPTDASYYTIAQISVPAAVTNIGGGGGGTITDKRTFTAALGGIINCTSTTRPTSPAPSQRIYETDTKRFLTYDGTVYRLDPGQVLHSVLRTDNAYLVQAQTGFQVAYTSPTITIEASQAYWISVRMPMISTPNANVDIDGVIATSEGGGAYVDKYKFGMGRMSLANSYYPIAGRVLYKAGAVTTLAVRLTSWASALYDVRADPLYNFSFSIETSGKLSSEVATS
jgi:hypothetical protein